MRILALLMGVCLVITNLAIRRRLPPAVKSTGSLISLRAYKNPAYTTYSVAGLLILLTMFAVSVIPASDAARNRYHFFLC